MPHITRFLNPLILLCALSSATALADDFAMLGCTLNSDGDLVASVADIADDGVGSVRLDGFEFDLVGQPCAVAVGRLLDAGFELISRSPITLCESGSCPASASADPDCLAWDLVGPEVYALVDCAVAAAGGPTVVNVQTSREPTGELLDNAVGMSCSRFMAEFLSAGGRIQGRSVVPFAAVLRLLSNRESFRKRHPYETLNNSILFELHAAD